MSDRPVVSNQQEPPPAKPKIRNKLPKRKPQTTYEYKLLSYIAARAEEEFDTLGEQGWLFIGREVSGRAVFMRKRTL